MVINEMEIAQIIELALEEATGDVSLLEIVKKAVPLLAEDSIKKYFSFIVNGKATRDFNTIVGKGDTIKVIPEFAGG